MLKALYPLSGAATTTSGILSFLLNLPIWLAAICAALAFASLRWMGFDKFESAVAAMLALLAAPVYIAFMPGLVISQTLALPFAFIGLFGVAFSAGEKEQTRQLAGMLLTLIGFGAAIWMHPPAALLLAGLLLGELGVAFQLHRGGTALGTGAILKLLVLLLPFAVLAMRPMDAFVFSMDGIIRLGGWAWALLGLASISVLAAVLGRKHPHALLSLTLILTAIGMSSISPAMACVALMLPACYGLHTLKQIEEEPLGWRALMVLVPVVVTVIGLMDASAQMEWVRNFGLAGLMGVAAVSLAHLWNWSAGFIRHSIGAFLLVSALMIAAGLLPGVDTGAVYPYQGMDASVQKILLNISSSNMQSGPIATMAGSDAVEFLSRQKAEGNETTLLRRLASNKSSIMPFSSGTRIVIPMSVFDSLPTKDAQLGRNWTMRAFHYVGTLNNQNGNMAVFFTQDGLRLDHPVDAQTGELGAERTYIYVNGQMVRILMVGEVQLLDSRLKYSDPTQLLIWPQDEANSKILSLFTNQTSGVQIIERTPQVLVLKVM
ncbi:Uncharacterised protein [uncultured archaeon]|nr:Uncharacterised protein [uncultured archaeon]